MVKVARCEKKTSPTLFQKNLTCLFHKQQNQPIKGESYLTHFSNFLVTFFAKFDFRDYFSFPKRAKKNAVKFSQKKI